MVRVVFVYVYKDEHLFRRQFDAESLAQQRRYYVLPLGPMASQPWDFDWV